ncbi:uncharacterized protein [Leptinotarsa decemlineata]|uniref:uncharacterized protein n=1 Tax=Leptinotarsa decemlineata TaxID=7539 RepID=UPI003D309548
MLNVFLLEGRIKYHEALQKKFNISDWLNLGKYILITVIVFNRRRPGEMERALIDDLEIIQKIDENSEIYEKLHSEERIYVDIYLRFIIRGKLARGVPVLIHKEVHASLKLFLSYRGQAGVLPSNPFIFGLPQAESENVVYRHLIATKLLQKFSEECGAQVPTALRGTILRKHVATFSMSMNLAIENCADLRKRTLPQIQLWIKNNLHQTSAQGKSWDSASIEIVQYIVGPSYPSTETIWNVTKNNPELADKTPRRIRSQIQNQKKLYQRSVLIQKKARGLNITL